MKTSDKGLNFISKWEGLRLDAYNDVGGKTTIGFGHLLTAYEKQTGKLITGADWRGGITDAQARVLLEVDVRSAETAVNELIAVPLSQPQFDALVSFTFNLGRGNLAGSTLLEKLNAGDYAAVPDELKRWNKAGGKVVAGLVSRRRAEGAMWRSAEIKPSMQSRTNQGAVTAAVGQVISVASEAQSIQSATSGLAASFGEYAQWAGIAMTIAGIAYVVYARWDDKRHGIR